MYLNDCIIWNQTLSWGIEIIKNKLGTKVLQKNPQTNDENLNNSISGIRLRNDSWQGDTEQTMKWQSVPI